MSVIDIPEAKQFGFTEPMVAIQYSEDGYIFVIAEQAEKMLDSLKDFKEEPRASLHDIIRAKLGVKPVAKEDKFILCNDEAGRDGLDPSPHQIKEWVDSARKSGNYSRFLKCSDEVLYKFTALLSDEERMSIATIRAQAVKGTHPNDTGIPMTLAPFVKGVAPEPVVAPQDAPIGNMEINSDPKSEDEYSRIIMAARVGAEEAIQSFLSKSTKPS
jgi:hypothetical protein